MSNIKTISKIKYFIFDLDGVLLDSRSNMQYAWNALRKDNLVVKQFKEYEKFIGLPFQKILLKLKIKLRKKDIEENYKKYSIKNFNKIKLFPNAKLVLKYLEKKSKICLVTSKDLLRTKKIIKKFNLKFESIHCPNSKFRGKPYPDQILNCLNKNRFKKKHAAYIGDTYHDYLAAKRAGITFIFATYGFGKQKKIYKNKIRNLKEIINYT